MTRLNTYTNAVTSITGDFETADTALTTLGFAAVNGEIALDQPGNIANYLRGRADAVDLPNSLVNALGGLPYGIGFAITQLNRVSNTVGFTIDQQAATLERLDALWEPSRASLGAFGDFLATLTPPMATFDALLENRATELELLGNAMGTQDIPDGTELAARMDAFSGAIGNWNAVKDTVLGPIGDLAEGLGAAITALENVLPNFSGLQSTINSAISVFASAAATAQSIYNSLNVNIDLGLTSFNLIDAISTISDFIGFLQGIIEGAVLGILEGLGFNTNIFAPVEDAILDLVEPVFAVLNGIQAAAASALGSITDWLSGAFETLDELLVSLGEAIGIQTLFANELSVTDPEGGALVGEGGEDALFGNEGDDTLDARGGHDFLFGGEGNDHLDGRSGKDELYGGAGTDTLIGGLGDDYIDGGYGRDLAVFADSFETVEITENGAWIQITSSEGVDAVWRVERVEFNGEVYTLDEVRAAADARTVFGTSASELLLGLPGDDTLFGRAGDDTLEGGAGADHLDGGAGRDTASYAGADRSVRVDLQNPDINYNDAAGDTYVSIEVFQTGAGIDQLRGDSGGNEFYSGGSTDRLYGRAGDDLLFGEAGADAFYGGLGADTMTGGDDAGRRDRYIYFNAAETGVGTGNRDVITDFISGEDRIELRRIDADITQGFKQGFDFIGDTDFSGTAGELRYEKIGGNTIVQADRDGDGAADLEIELTGIMDLTTDDFLV